MYGIGGIAHAAFWFHTLYCVQHPADLDGVTWTAPGIDVQQGAQQRQCGVALIVWNRLSEAVFFCELEGGRNCAAMHPPQ